MSQAHFKVRQMYSASPPLSRQSQSVSKFAAVPRIDIWRTLKRDFLTYETRAVDTQEEKKTRPSTWLDELIAEVEHNGFNTELITLKNIMPEVTDDYIEDVRIITWGSLLLHTQCRLYAVCRSCCDSRTTIASGASVLDFSWRA